MIEGGKVLVLTLPVGACDVNFLTPLQEYLLHGLETRCLVLPRDAQLEVRDFPALGAAEVHVEAAVKKKVGRPKKAVPESGTEAAPAPLRESAIPKPKPARTRSAPRWTLPMTAGEIAASYRQAAKPKAQIGVLAELNVCSKERILEVLAAEGVELVEKGGADG